MQELLDSSLKTCQLLLLNLSLKIWDYMDKDAEIWHSPLLTLLRRKESSVNLDFSLDPSVSFNFKLKGPALLSMVPELQILFWTLLLSTNNGSKKLETWPPESHKWEVNSLKNWRTMVHLMIGAISRSKLECSHSQYKSFHKILGIKARTRKSSCREISHLPPFKWTYLHCWTQRRKC